MASIKLSTKSADVANNTDREYTEQVVQGTDYIPCDAPGYPFPITQSVCNTPRSGIGNSDIAVSTSSFRNTGDVLEAFAAMPSAQLERAVSLLEAMVVGRGVREAGIAFLKARGVKNAAIEADRILNDAEGVA